MIDMNSVRALLERAANAHLYEVMGNKKLYMMPDNFSTVQYMNLLCQTEQVKFKKDVINRFSKYDKNAAYLNIGTAVGHLELVNRLMGSPIHISSVEWDEQYECCQKVREIFDIPIHYMCNDVLSDKFEIFNIKTYFDYAIMERFFPIYRSNTHERIKAVLTKFIPYAKRALIIESKQNWSKEQFHWLSKVSEKRLKLSENWDCFVVKLEQFK